MIIKLVFSIEMTYFFSGRDSVPQGQRHSTQGHQAREHSVVQGRGGSVSVQSNSMKIRVCMCGWMEHQLQQIFPCHTLIGKLVKCDKNKTHFNILMLIH